MSVRCKFCVRKSQQFVNYLFLNGRELTMDTANNKIRLGATRRDIPVRECEHQLLERSFEKDTSYA
jgi:hypothetical protein